MGLSPQLQNQVVPDFLIGIAGQIADLQHYDAISANLEGLNNIPFGVGLKKGVNPDGYTLPAGYGDLIEAIAIHSQAVNNIGFGALPPYNVGVAPGQMFGGMRQGYIYVTVEEAVSAHDPVFCRFGASANFAQSAGPWVPFTPYVLGQQVTNYGSLYKCVQAGTSGPQGGPPSGGPASGNGIGGTSVGGPTGNSSAITDGAVGSSVVWQFVGPALLQVGGFRKSADAAVASAWVLSTVYALNALVSNGGNAYVCSIAGTSAGSGGPAGNGTAIVDGSCTWKYLATLGTSWVLSTAYLVGALVTNGGGAYLCTGAGTSAASVGPLGFNPDVLDGTCHWKYLGAANASAGQVKGAKYTTAAAAGQIARLYYDAGVASN